MKQIWNSVSKCFFSRYYKHPVLIIIILSLHVVHRENALWTGHVCLYVCPLDSDGGPLDELKLNLM